MMMAMSRRPRACSSRAEYRLQQRSQSALVGARQAFRLVQAEQPSKARHESSRLIDPSIGASHPPYRIPRSGDCPWPRPHSHRASGRTALLRRAPESGDRGHSGAASGRTCRGGRPRRRETCAMTFTIGPGLRRAICIATFLSPWCARQFIASTLPPDALDDL